MWHARALGQLVTIFPRNLTACFCKLIPINAALETSLHGKGSPAIYVCTRPFYVHTNRLIIEAVYACVCVDLSRRCPQNLAALKLSPYQTGPWNKISPWRDFEEIQYMITYNAIQVHSCGYSRHALIACTTLWHCYSSTSCYCAYLRLAAASAVRRGFCIRVLHWACPSIILQLAPTEADNIVTN